MPSKCATPGNLQSTISFSKLFKTLGTQNGTSKVASRPNKWVWLQCRCKFFRHVLPTAVPWKFCSLRDLKEANVGVNSRRWKLTVFTCELRPANFRIWPADMRVNSRRWKWSDFTYEIPPANLEPTGRNKKKSLSIWLHEFAGFWAWDIWFNESAGSRVWTIQLHESSCFWTWCMLLQNSRSHCRIWGILDVGIFQQHNTWQQHANLDLHPPSILRCNNSWHDTLSHNMTHYRIHYASFHCKTEHAQHTQYWARASDLFVLTAIVTRDGWLWQTHLFIDRLRNARNNVTLLFQSKTFHSSETQQKYTIEYDSKANHSIWVRRNKNITSKQKWIPPWFSPTIHQSAYLSIRQLTHLSVR